MPVGQRFAKFLSVLMNALEKHLSSSSLWRQQLRLLLDLALTSMCSACCVNIQGLTSTHQDLSNISNIQCHWSRFGLCTLFTCIGGVLLKHKLGANFPKFASIKRGRHREVCSKPAPRGELLFYIDTCRIIITVLSILSRRFGLCPTSARWSMEF